MSNATSVSTRKQGWEWKTAYWVLRHPQVMIAPTVVTAGMTQVGIEGVAIGAATAAAGAIGWYRGHPASWDRWMAPRVRSWRRRWLSRSYMGKWWLDTVASCKLMEHDTATGEPRPPRVVKIEAHSPVCETVHVRLPKGQSEQSWTDARDALTMALGAERVTIEVVSRKKRLIAIVVQRHNPFDEVIASPAIPKDSASVDLTSIYLGLTEFGTQWRASILAQHWLVSGAIGSGKSSVVWSLLRELAPLVSDGIVRLWVIDPKQVELSKLKPVSYRYATETEHSWNMLSEFWSVLEERKKHLTDQGQRKFTPSRDTPLDVLIIDELAAVTAYSGAAKDLRNVERTLSLIMSQGRALGGAVVGCVQEPTKDVVGMRELFTWRTCMRSTSAQHPDMVLGEDMRLRGALADEIPNVSDTAGVGYVIKERTRTPINVRAAYVNDAFVDEIVTAAGWPITALTNNDTAADDTAETKTNTKEKENHNG